MSNFVELILTCVDRVEAEKIADALLDQKLVACVKFVPVESRYWWHGKIEDSEEVMLLMEGVADNFDRVEKEVTRLHSYDTPVLLQVPIERVSARAQAWIKEVINPKD